MALSEEEQRKAMETAPKGTLAVLIVYGAVFMVLWLAIYFGTVVARGPVS